jgi:oxygen-independent coproporphyrinogen III oxidase
LAGLYIHIPFCRKLCYYCDFHFTVSVRWKERMMEALCMEIVSRKDEGNGKLYDSIYLGGGTPSILSVEQINVLLSALNKQYRIDLDAEITLEANPDDLSEEYLAELRKHSLINRLSIGVQSFQDKHLMIMNRRHNAVEARRSIERALSSGFSNINIDLIYGIPGLSNEEWLGNLEIFKGYRLPHLSAYHLTFEPKTVFTHYLKKGKLKEVNEESSLEQYNTLLDFAEQAGYDNYEISNFAFQDFFSRHNLGYWKGHEYIGFGPSAHSFNSKQRRWNKANNTIFMHSLETGRDDYYETEKIDHRTAFNEYLLTSLRTKWGISMPYLKRHFNDFLDSKFEKKIESFIENGSLGESIDNYFLSRKGKMISDYIISELMAVD